MYHVAVTNRLSFSLPHRRKGLQLACVRSVTQVSMGWAARTQRDMQKAGLYARGDLIRSVRAKVRARGRRVEGTLTANVKYAQWVHDGREPGKMPPMKPILDWVHVKRMTGRYSIRTHRRLGNKYQQRFEDFEVARRIQWAIYKRGIRPKPFFDQSFDEHKTWAHRTLVKTLPDQVGKAWRA